MDSRKPNPESRTSRMKYFNILVAEKCSILASRLNPAHQCDGKSSVKAPIIRKLDVASQIAIKHVRFAWFVVGSVCNSNFSQDPLWLSVFSFCCFIAGIQRIEGDRFWYNCKLENKNTHIICIVTSNMKIRQQKKHSGQEFPNRFSVGILTRFMELAIWYRICFSASLI